MSWFGRAEAARARFYGALGDAIGAGLPIGEALALVGEGYGGASAAAREARYRIDEGAGLSEALAASGAFAPLEVEGLAAGEASGRLDDVLRRLERRFGARGVALERIHGGLVYPVLLLHAAVLLPKLNLLILQTTKAYLVAVLPPLLALYGVTGGLWLLAAGVRRVPAAAAALDRVLFALPLIGRIVRAQASADLAEALALLLSSGIGIVEALDRGAAGLARPTARAAALRARERVARERCPLAEGLAPERGLLSPLLIDAVRAGEPAGKLDDALDRAARALRADADRGLAVIIKVAPTLVFLGVAGYVAWVVISSYLKIYQDVLRF